MRVKLVVNEPTLCSPTREADVGDRAVGRPQQRRGALEPAGEQVRVRATRRTRAGTRARSARARGPRPRPCRRRRAARRSGASARSLARSRCRAGGTKAIATEYRRYPRAATRSRLRAGDEAHLHLHRRGARARDALASCRSSRRSPAPAGVDVELRDISLAGRILAQFPDRLTDEQRVPDALAELGELAKTPEANIIKLPNISASIPQLKAAIKELQDAGYDDPRLPGRPATDEEQARARGLRPRSRAARSTRCCARATPTAARPRRSRRSRASTRTRWARGRRTPGRTCRR